MTLEDYFNSLSGPAAKRAFADRIPTSYDYLKHLVNGRRNVNEGMAMKIEAASDGAVPCEVSCPDADWRSIRERRHLSKAETAA